MARVKGAMMTRKRRNKVLKAAKGYWGAKSKRFKMAKQAVMKSGNYSSSGKAILAYGLFSLWIFGNYLPLFTDYEGYFAQRADYGQAYIDAVQKLMPLWMAPVLLASCFVCGIIGGLIGRALLKKHFEKAGLT